MERGLVVSVVAIAALGACAGVDDGRTEPSVGPPSASTTSSPTGTTTTTTTITTTTGLPAMLPSETTVEDVRRQIADRYGYPFEQVVAERVEAVEWRDAALGCPQTEREYAPGPIPGYRIVLRYGDLEFHFHGAAGEPPFHCQFLD